MDAMVLYLEFIRAKSISITDLTKSSYVAVTYVMLCSLLKGGETSVDCVNVQIRLTSAVRKKSILTYSLLQSIKFL